MATKLGPVKDDDTDEDPRNKQGTSTLSTKDWLLKLHAKGFFTLDSVHNILANAKKNQELEKSTPDSSRSRRGAFRVQPQRVKTFTTAVAKQSPMGNPDLMGRFEDSAVFFENEQNQHSAHSQDIYMTGLSQSQPAHQKVKESDLGGNPGPGTYAIGGIHDGKLFGRFSKSVVPSSIDREMKRAEEIPDPGQYEEKNVWGKDHLKRFGKGGRISAAVTKSDVEWAIYHGREVPGPGHYGDVQYNRFTNGFQFSTACPKSELDWKLYHTQHVPGPSKYSPPVDSPNDGRSFSFGAGCSKSDLDWKIYYAKKVPGPGTYSVPSLPLPKGGTFSDAVVPSSNHVSKADSLLPGPGEYSPPSFVDVIKGGVIAHANADHTYQAMLAEAASTPGPGAYDVSHRFDKDLNSSPGIYRQRHQPSEIVKEHQRIASTTPGPSDYAPDVHDTFLDGVSGGRINASGDRMPGYQNSIPGPGAYNPESCKPGLSGKGGRFTGVARSILDPPVHQSPGPGDYDIEQPGDAYKRIRGGAIARDSPREGKVYARNLARARDDPGPGTYDPDPGLVWPASLPKTPANEEYLDSYYTHQGKSVLRTTGRITTPYELPVSVSMGLFDAPPS